MIEKDSLNLKPTIPILVILTFEFIIGCCLQVKKIKRVKQEKAFTWELEMYHSIVCISFFSFSVGIEIFEQIIPQDGKSSQVVLCTLARFIKELGVNAIYLHSLSISLCKYIVIVRCKGLSSWKKNTKRLVISIIIAYPIVWTALGMISRGISSGKASRNDFIKSSISLCDGQDLNGALSEPSTRGLFCGFNERGNKSSQSSFIFITTEFFCFVQTLVTLIVNMNVLEAFLYFKIFQSMNR